MTANVSLLRLLVFILIILAAVIVFLYLFRRGEEATGQALDTRPLLTALGLESTGNSAARFDRPFHNQIIGSPVDVELTVFRLGQPFTVVVVNSQGIVLGQETQTALQSQVSVSVAFSDSQVADGQLQIRWPQDSADDIALPISFFR